MGAGAHQEPAGAHFHQEMAAEQHFPSQAGAAQRASFRLEQNDYGKFCLPLRTIPSGRSLKHVARLVCSGLRRQSVPHWASCGGPPSLRPCPLAGSPPACMSFGKVELEVCSSRGATSVACWHRPSRSRELINRRHGPRTWPWAWTEPRAGRTGRRELSGCRSTSDPGPPSSLGTGHLVCLGLAF